MVRKCAFEIFRRLLAYSSLRKGELCALKWQDLNIDTEIVSVSKSLDRIDGYAIKKALKINFPLGKLSLTLRL